MLTHQIHKHVNTSGSLQVLLQFLGIICLCLLWCNFAVKVTLFSEIETKMQDKMGLCCMCLWHTRISLLFGNRGAIKGVSPVLLVNTLMTWFMCSNKDIKEEKKYINTQNHASPQTSSLQARAYCQHPLLSSAFPFIQQKAPGTAVFSLP